jgi:tRNA G46 methylase TrmB
VTTIHPDNEHEKRRQLAAEVAEDVWRRLAGNGSLRINIDTDVDCYGQWEPHKKTEPTEYDKVVDAQSWVEYFVRSTINRLMEKGRLT